MKTRRAAAFAMARWLATKEFPVDILPRGPERSGAQEILYTAIRRLRPLRKVLGELMTVWPKGELEALLYVGAAQILYMPSVPDFAAVNETVDAAKLCENKNIAKVVNGVLRNLLRRREEFENLLASSSLELRESYPTVLIKRWQERFGLEGAEKMAMWHNKPAETFLAYRNGEFAALPHGMKVTEAQGFAEGDFIVQDPATRLAVGLLDPQPGDKVLDACAAPGGKTIQIAWRGADVTACEVNPKRRRRLEENLARTRVDVKVISALGEGLFNKVLVDAPCSNTGVLRRKPDARWNWSEEKLSELVKLQRQILDQVVRQVAPGGSLVYSTCSNESEENVMQVQAFLERHSDFDFVEATESISFESGSDGAFAALLRRR